ncbi:MAG: 2-isopropylmalate synthase [Leptolyngbyaceae cyanobacterium bins.349]|nr:2-isopropylmalate synthase [Leptolyngbyaceae cyanobacterium bins.349]
MLNHPATKYHAFTPVVPNATPDNPFGDRAWVHQTLTRPPLWLSTDLRDGNQALIEPMSVQRKLKLFQMLVRLGFKEIEVAFPAASQTDFDFVRHLIEHDLIPPDVTIQVLTQAREDLIRRTFESLIGVKQAIVHVYNATSPVFRQVVFGLDRLGTINLAVSAAQLMKDLAAAQPSTHWRFQYSPETFTATELDFAKEISDAVMDVWQPTPDHKAILNLPATVEVAMPNVFADQVEWMHRHLARRDSIILSVHPHNDRGCAIAAAELAQLAGAERVEGCLFGNGERTGNVDLVTLALNLYTQGIHPGLDFSQINEVARTVEDCTQLPIHPRHPYVGDLVFTAFSGSHQDAIKKGFAAQKADAVWAVPYLPLDPADVGRNYESVVRVNSQSGKGGIAFLLEREWGLVLPRRLQIEFSQVVQHVMDTSGQEMTAAELWQLFAQEYLQATTPVKYLEHQSLEHSGGEAIAVKLQLHDQIITLQGQGNGPIDAFVHALNLNLRIHHYEERSLEQGSQAQAVAFVELAADFMPHPLYGVGLHTNIVTASILAVMSAINRGLQPVSRPQQMELLQPLHSVESRHPIAQA